MKKLRTMNLTIFSLWIGLTFGGRVWGWVLKEMLPGTRKARRERKAEIRNGLRGNQEPQNQFLGPTWRLGASPESCCSGKAFE